MFSILTIICSIHKSKFINVYACRLKSWLVSSDVVMKSLPHKDHHKAEKLLKDDQKTLPAKAELLLLLLSHFSRVRLCATPQTAAHQAPPSLGFSRQEHWTDWVAISFSSA